MVPTTRVTGTSNRVEMVPLPAANGSSAQGTQGSSATGTTSKLDISTGSPSSAGNSTGTPTSTFEKSSSTPAGGTSVYGGDNSMQGTKSIVTKDAGSGAAADAAKTGGEMKSSNDMKSNDTQSPAAPKSPVGFEWQRFDCAYEFWADESAEVESSRRNHDAGNFEFGNAGGWHGDWANDQHQHQSVRAISWPKSAASKFSRQRRLELR